MRFRRQNIRLPPARYVGRRRYFLTLCCDRQARALGDAALAQRVIDILRDLSARHAFAVYAYCLMPDHMHALVEAQDPSSNLLNFVAHFKRQTTTEFHKTSASTPLWQKKYYDHILRPKDSADSVAAYIWMNPVRKGLCCEPEDYSHSGSFVLDGARPTNPATLWTPPWKAIL